MTPDLLIALTAARALDTSFHVPGTNRPMWTIAEAAQACQGIPDYKFAAMLYSFAGAVEMYFRLHDALYRSARRMQRELQLPAKVKRAGVARPYLQDLCGIYLIEERTPWRFVRTPNQANLRRVLLGIEEHTWRRHVSPVYEAVRAEYLCWLGDGCGSMARWIKPAREAA